MPRVESHRTKSKSPPPPTAVPLSPHRIGLPMSPAAAPRSNPIDSSSSHTRSSPTTTRTVKDDASDTSASPSRTKTSARAVSEAPPSSTRPPVQATRSTSTGSVSGTRSTAPPPGDDKPATSKDDKDEDEHSGKPIVDLEVFNQVLELDEDDDTHEFSHSIVANYFQQVKDTLDQFRDALKGLEKVMTDDGLKTLSNLGHFLKGSSAALGVLHVRDNCEDIQHAGKLRGKESEELSKDEAVRRITRLVQAVDRDFQKAEKWFKDYYVSLKAPLPDTPVVEP